MTTVDIRQLISLEALYDREGDPSFARAAAALDPDDEQALADLIEADGRLRLRLGMTVELDRYLESVPALQSRPDPLDAAIDMALRSLARHGGASGDDPGAALCAAYPVLAPAIREAAALGDALWSTTRLRANVASRPETRVLPCPFGPPLEDGTRRYELKELLGEGAFGQVYLAVDRGLSEDDHEALVSIKLLTARARSDWEQQRLVEEATKARRVEHPNVVRVIDRGTGDRGEQFIVYEYVSGGDLGRCMRRHRGPLPVERAVRIAASIARGVHAAHMAGLVHCDLKPANIMLTGEGEAKVGDFGIAIRAEEQTGLHPGDAASEDERPPGNLAFMSPEQFRGDCGALNMPTDLYALGGIFYWLLTSRLPNGSTPEEIAAAHATIDRPPPSPRDHRRDVDHDLVAICRRSMAPQPADRYDSAAAFADDLDAWLRREPLRWTPTSLRRRLRLWAARKPALVAALVAICILLIASAYAAQRLAYQDAVRRGYSDSLARIRTRLHDAAADGLTRDLLPQIELMEWVFGPNVFDAGDEFADVWRLRIPIIREILAESERAGFGSDLEATAWRTALGYWLLTDGQAAEAEMELSRAAREWDRLLPLDDPTRLQAHALHALAIIQQIDGEACDTSLDAPALALLADQVDRVERARAILKVRSPGTPVHKQLLEGLSLAYGPGLLDHGDPHLAANIELDMIIAAEEHRTRMNRAKRSAAKKR